jgi:hypothetical protein
VAVLARRRDAITGELGQLSGVIQALAVPTDTTTDQSRDDRTPEHDDEEDGAS